MALEQIVNRATNLITSARNVANNAADILKKPDGSAIQQFSDMLGLSQGTAAPKAKTEGAVDKIKDGKPTVDTATPTKSGIAGKNLTRLVPNPLEQFSTVSFLWTLAVLTPYQFNNPPSYRNGGLDLFGLKTLSGQQSSIIFSSAGRGDAQRVATAFGTPEYYIDNFEMAAVIAANEQTGNQNAISFTFNIVEPFSMGLLLQSMQVAAIKAGFVNYIDAPFVLRLDIKGFAENGTPISSVKPKYFVLKFKKITFTVNEGGSMYSCEAVPYNYQGYSDTVNTSFTDINIEASENDGDSLDAGTVRDVLATGSRSLVRLLNDAEAKNVAEKKYSVKDVYEIQFPEESDMFISNNAANAAGTNQATVNPDGSDASRKAVGTNASATQANTNIGNNPIARSDFGFGVGKGGNFPFKKDGDVIDEKTGRVRRGSMEIDEKKRTFQFMQKQALTDIITQIILSSTYAKQAIQKSTDTEGMIDWFKLDVQIELLDFDIEVGDFAKKYIYRVVPFKAHSSIFGNPNAVPPGYAQLEKSIVKEYNYIYTGQNVDILNFNVELNQLFYTGINSSSETNTKNEQNKDSQGTTTQTPKSTKTSNGGEPTAQKSNLGKSKVKRSPELLSSMRGGSGSVDVEQMVAQNFQKAFTTVSSKDLVRIELQILGDTFWVVDSGMANYFAKKSEISKQLTEDGTMNYEGGDIYIYLRFRSPADVNEKTGQFEFSPKEKESDFSGIYRVTKCTSNFSGGNFTQTLTCVRMQAQPQDLNNKPATINKNASVAKEIGGKTAPKVSVSTDETYYDDFYG